MTTQGALSAFLHDFLHVDDVPDAWCVNGVQVPGKTEINKIAVGVSASRNFLQHAAEWQADAVLVHHGLFWNKGVRTIDSLLSKRLAILYKSDISLFAYHLPLDAHPTIGNNARIAQDLQATTYDMRDICAIAEFAEPVQFSEFLSRCETLFGQAPIFASPKENLPVKKLGICSGGGADFVYDIVAQGIDTFLTGEISEHHFHEFAELDIRFVVCGHYATETFGVRALQTVLQKQFPELELSFFSEPCPV